MPVEDCILPRGGGPDGSKPVYVRGGTEVNFVFRAMHYDKDLWENADEFRLERWESPTSIPPGAYVPFNSGGRVCPAQQMVLNEYTYILVRLVQDFKQIENRDPEEKFME
jgi:cytochrome P450